MNENPTHWPKSKLRDQAPPGRDNSREVKPRIKKTTSLRVSAKRSPTIGISFTKYRQNVHRISAFRSPPRPVQPLFMRLSGAGKNVKKVFKYNVKRGTVKAKERSFREDV